MSIEVMTRVFNVPAEQLSNPSHRLVLVNLADHANEDSECWPKNSTVAAKAGLSVHRVKVIIRELEERGFLERGHQRKRRDGSLGARIMRLVVPVMGGAPTTPPSDNGVSPTHPSPGGQGVAHDTLGVSPTTPHEPLEEPPELIEPSTRAPSVDTTEVGALCEHLADTIAPYTRFVRTENERLESEKAELEALAGKIEQMKIRVRDLL